MVGGLYLCGGGEAEQNAEDQVGVFCGNEDQVTQNPGQTEQDSQREAEQNLLGHRWMFGAGERQEREVQFPRKRREALKHWKKKRIIMNNNNDFLEQHFPGTSTNRLMDLTNDHNILMNKLEKAIWFRGMTLKFIRLV